MIADLHLHSYASGDDTNGFLSVLGCRECYSDPKELYFLAKRRNMDFFTITDHNTINGCLEIANLEDVFISEEVSTYFPEDKTEVHVLVFDIDEALHRDIDRLRQNIYELTQFLFQKGIPYALAHPLYSPNGKITPFHLERFFILFDLWEGENGSRPKILNELTKNVARSKDFSEIELLAEKYSLPLLRRNKEISFTGGSDDHSGFGVGKATTSAASANNLEEFFKKLKSGKVIATNNGSGTVHLARTVYAVSYHYLKTQINLDKKTDKILDKVFLKRKRVPFFLKLKFATPKKDDLKSIMLKNLAKGNINVNIDNGLEIKLFFREVAQRYSDSLNPLNFATLLKIPGVLGNLMTLYLFAAPYLGALIVESKRRREALSLYHSFFNKNAPNSQKIAYFTDTYFEVNGVSRTNQDLRKFAQEKNLDLEVIISRKLFSLEEKLKNIAPIFEMPLPVYPEIKLGFPDPLELVDYCCQNNITHIHAATPGSMGLFGMFAAKTLRLPFTIAHHTDLVQYAGIYSEESLQGTLRKYLSWLYGQANKVLVPSEFTKREVIENFNTVPDDILVFHRGVDLRQFNPGFRDEDCFGKYKGFSGRPVVLYVGRVAKEKGLDIFCEVAKLVKERYSNLTFVVVGDGPYREELERKWGHIVIFTGMKSGNDLSAAYASSDIFLFPSPTETFGMVVLEAQASGIPAIVSKEGAAKENIKEGETGFSCVQEIRAFYKCLVSLLKDKEKLCNMKKASREAVLSRPLEGGLREMIEKITC